MAVGSALIGLSDPPNDLVEVIERFGCGVNVRPDDLAGLVSAIKQLHDDRDYLMFCKNASRNAAVRNFNRNTNTQHFVDVILSSSSE